MRKMREGLEGLGRYVGDIPAEIYRVLGRNESMPKTMRFWEVSAAKSNLKVAVTALAKALDKEPHLRVVAFRRAEYVYLVNAYQRDFHEDPNHPSDNPVKLDNA